jgi:hypothetical protein
VHKDHPIDGVTHRDLLLGRVNCGQAANYAGPNRLATWRMSGEPIDSCTLPE